MHCNKILFTCLTCFSVQNILNNNFQILSTKLLSTVVLGKMTFNTSTYIKCLLEISEIIPNFYGEVKVRQIMHTVVYF